MSVQSEIAHIRLHLQAEDDTRDSSQALGFRNRIRQVFVLLNQFSNLDTRVIPRGALLQEMRGRSVSTALRTVLQNIDADDDGQSLHAVLLAWAQDGVIRSG